MVDVIELNVDRLGDRDIRALIVGLGHVGRGQTLALTIFFADLLDELAAELADRTMTVDELEAELFGEGAIVESTAQAIIAARAELRRAAIEQSEDPGLC